ncbi:hypothetical protein AX14_014206 [Amanita brunnescens Koide BX004]|nr:hypothetical protein AX14_014206 [Amanita brunnescens Koide BX004]
MAAFIRAYNSALLNRPLLTNCLSAAVLFGAGDIIAQQAIEKKGGINGHDFARTARLTFYGGALLGPCLTGWYGFLNRIKFANPKRGVAYRVYLDQAIFAPAIVVFFYGSMSVLEGKPHEAIDRLKRAYVPTLLRNWAVYIPTQIINFSIVPHHLRFPVVSVVGLFWNTYLSVENAQQQRIEEAEGGAEAPEEKA